jgi:8-oxo-dGTP pyrophosphatase MutT (NUDIX family)
LSLTFADRISATSGLGAGIGLSTAAGDTPNTAFQEYARAVSPTGAAFFQPQTLASIQAQTEANRATLLPGEVPEGASNETGIDRFLMRGPRAPIQWLSRLWGSVSMENSEMFAGYADAATRGGMTGNGPAMLIAGDTYRVASDVGQERVAEAKQRDAEAQEARRAAGFKDPWTDGTTADKWRAATYQWKKAWEGDDTTTEVLRTIASTEPVLDKHGNYQWQLIDDDSDRGKEIKNYNLYSGGVGEKIKWGAADLGLDMLLDPLNLVFGAGSSISRSARTLTSADVTRAAVLSQTAALPAAQGGSKVANAWADRRAINFNRKVSSSVEDYIKTRQQGHGLQGVVTRANPLFKQVDDKGVVTAVFDEIWDNADNVQAARREMKDVIYGLAGDAGSVRRIRDNYRKSYVSLLNIVDGYDHSLRLDTILNHPNLAKMGLTPSDVLKADKRLQIEAELLDTDPKTLGEIQDIFKKVREEGAVYLGGKESQKVIGKAEKTRDVWQRTLDEATQGLETTKVADDTETFLASDDLLSEWDLRDAGSIGMLPTGGQNAVHAMRKGALGSSALRHAGVIRVGAFTSPVHIFAGDRIPNTVDLTDQNSYIYFAASVRRFQREALKQANRSGTLTDAAVKNFARRSNELVSRYASTSGMADARGVVANTGKGANERGLILQQFDELIADWLGDAYISSNRRRGDIRKQYLDFRSLARKDAQDALKAARNAYIAGKPVALMENAFRNLRVVDPALGKTVSEQGIQTTHVLPDFSRVNRAFRDKYKVSKGEYDYDDVEADVLESYNPDRYRKAWKEGGKAFTDRNPAVQSVEAFMRATPEYAVKTAAFLNRIQLLRPAYAIRNVLESYMRQAVQFGVAQATMTMFRAFGDGVYNQTRVRQGQVDAARRMFDEHRRAGALEESLVGLEDRRAAAATAQEPGMLPRKDAFEPSDAKPEWEQSVTAVAGPKETGWSYGRMTDAAAQEASRAAREAGIDVSPEDARKIYPLLRWHGLGRRIWLRRMNKKARAEYLNSVGEIVRTSTPVEHPLYRGVTINRNSKDVQEAEYVANIDSLRPGSIMETPIESWTDNVDVATSYGTFGRRNKALRAEVEAEDAAVAANSAQGDLVIFKMESGARAARIGDYSDKDEMGELVTAGRLLVTKVEKDGGKTVVHVRQMNVGTIPANADDALTGRVVYTPKEGTSVRDAQPVPDELDVTAESIIDPIEPAIPAEIFNKKYMTDYELQELDSHIAATRLALEEAKRISTMTYDEYFDEFIAASRHQVDMEKFQRPDVKKAVEDAQEEARKSADRFLAATGRSRDSEFEGRLRTRLADEKAAAEEKILGVSEREAKRRRSEADKRIAAAEKRVVRTETILRRQAGSSFKYRGGRVKQWDNPADPYRNPLDDFHDVHGDAANVLDGIFNHSSNLAIRNLLRETGGWKEIEYDPSNPEGYIHAMASFVNSQIVKDRAHRKAMEPGMTAERLAEWYRHDPEGQEAFAAISTDRNGTFSFFGSDPLNADSGRPFSREGVQRLIANPPREIREAARYMPAGPIPKTDIEHYASIDDWDHVADNVYRDGDVAYVVETVPRVEQARYATAEVALLRSLGLQTEPIRLVRQGDGSLAVAREAGAEGEGSWTNEGLLSQYLLGRTPGSNRNEENFLGGYHAYDTPDGTVFTYAAGSGPWDVHGQPRGDWGPVVQELNLQYLASTLSTADVRREGRRLAALTDEQIDNAFAYAGFDADMAAELAATVKSRRDYITNWIDYLNQYTDVDDLTGAMDVRFRPTPQAFGLPKGDGYVNMPDGTRRWGRYGAAGALVRHVDPQTGEARFLVQIRKGEGEGRWQYPGGALDRGESLTHGIAREMQEEGDFDTEWLDSLTPHGKVVSSPTMSGKADGKDVDWQYRTVAADAKSMATPLKDHESLDIRWVTEDEIREAIARGDAPDIADAFDDVIAAFDTPAAPRPSSPVPHAPDRPRKSDPRSPDVSPLERLGYEPHIDKWREILDEDTGYRLFDSGGLEEMARDGRIRYATEAEEARNLDEARQRIRDAASDRHMQAALRVTGNVQALFPDAASRARYAQGAEMTEASAREIVDRTQTMALRNQFQGQRLPVIPVQAYDERNVMAGLSSSGRVDAGMIDKVSRSTGAQQLHDWWFHIASTIPEAVFSQSPHYRYFWDQEWAKALGTQKVENLSIKEINAIRRRVGTRARRLVGEHAFDTRQQSAFSGSWTAQALLPFFGAWEDSLRKWAKIGAENPFKTLTAVRLITTPERWFPIVTNDNGVIIGDGNVYRQNADGSLGGVMREAEKGEGYMVLQLPEWAQKGPLAHQESLRFSKASLNMAWGGSPWWMPGTGPLVTVPFNHVTLHASEWGWLTDGLRAMGADDAADQIASGKLGRDVVESEVGDWVTNNQGFTREGVVAQVTPSAIMSLYRAATADMNDEQVAQQMAVYESQAYADWVAAGKDPDDLAGIREEAAGRLRGSLWIRAFGTAVSPVSMSGTPELSFYRAKYNEYVSQYGVEAQERFDQDFPEYSGINVSLSINNTGISATSGSMEQAMLNRRLISSEPEFGWAVAGPAGDEAFSSNVYDQQLSLNLDETTTSRWREKASPEDALREARINEGWAKWNALSTAINLQMEAQGITSLASKDGAVLKMTKDNMFSALAEENHYWAQEYRNGFGSDRTVKFLSYMQRVIPNMHGVEGREDIQALQEYMAMREQFQGMMRADGVNSIDPAENRSSIPTGDGSRFMYGLMWDNMVSTLISRGNLGFEQMYNRVLQYDDLAEDVIG